MVDFSEGNEGYKTWDKIWNRNWDLGPRAGRRRIRPGHLPSAGHAPTPTHPPTCTLHTIDINTPRHVTFFEEEQRKQYSVVCVDNRFVTLENSYQMNAQEHAVAFKRNDVAGRALTTRTIRVVAALTSEAFFAQVQREVSPMTSGTASAHRPAST